MGARENQGLQIALIIFVMITVVLAVTTYMYWKKYDESEKVAKQKEDSEAAAQTVARSLQTELEQIKKMLGYTPEVKIADIEKNFQNDMSVLYGPEFTGVDKQKDYRKVGPFFLDEVAKRSTALKDALDKLAKATADIDIARREEQVRTAAAVANANTHKSELEAELARYKAAEAAITDANSQTRTKLSEAEAKAQADAEKAARAIATVDTQLKKAEQQVDILQTQVAGTRVSNGFESADGKVTWVGQGSRLVWVNLGSADGLRRQITFSVVDRSASDVTKAKSKGSIEVTKILDSHLAEARIVSDDLGDPILSGDQVFTPVWQPGQKLRFALVGFMDLDGDGVSDRARIRSIISQNAGQIDAEVSDDGKRTGRIEVNTRYIVVGDRPDEKSGAEALTAYTALIAEAKKIGIEQLPLDRFLSMMGYRENDRTVQLGRGAAAEDFRARPADGVVRKSTGATHDFKERRPPEPGKKGAF